MSPSPHKPLRIIVADDRPDICDALAILIEKMGHTIIDRVYSGDKVLEAIVRHGRHNIDLLCVDARMPPGPYGGLTASKEAYEKHEELPSMIVTGGVEDELENSLADEEHVTHFFRKPVDATALRVALAGVRREKARNKRRRTREDSIVFTAVSYARQDGDDYADAYNRFKSYASHTQLGRVEAAEQLVRDREEIKRLQNEFQKKLRSREEP